MLDSLLMNDVRMFIIINKISITSHHRSEMLDNLHKIPHSLPLALANGLMIKPKLALAKNISIILAKANSLIHLNPWAKANGNEYKF